MRSEKRSYKDVRFFRYMGDDGISCIFDQLPDHELVEDCGWVLDKAHDDLDNFKLGLIRILNELFTESSL